MNLFRIAFASVALVMASWTGVHASPCVVLSAAGEIQEFSSYSEFVLLSDAEGSNLSEWNRSIRAAPHTSLYYSVTGHVPTNETVIKADSIVFNQGGTLEFQNLDARFWAIVAKTLVFNFRPRGEDTSTAPDRSEQVRIVRHANYSVPIHDQASHGQDGGRHNRARARKGVVGRTGNPGEHGAPGIPGGTKELPCLVLIVSDVVFNGSNSTTPNANVRGLSACLSECPALPYRRCPR